MIRDKNECTIIVFYETWGRRDGYNGLSYEQMQDGLKRSYSSFASSSQPASLAPAGEAFRGFEDRQSLYAGRQRV